jgi:D-arabinose 1-dehydrogenase-like Zn-dependent alcohol dehydrogenase
VPSARLARYQCTTPGSASGVAEAFRALVLLLGRIQGRPLTHQNPTDWKHTAFLSPKGAISGCDFSGTVVQISDSVTNKSLQVGDKVAGVVHGGMFENGAAAEYTRVQSDLMWKVPEGLKMDEAATFGIGWFTSLHVSVVTAVSVLEGIP